MSDQTPHHPTTDPDNVDRPEPRRSSHNIPPLVWIIVAILVAWFVVMAVQRRGGVTESPSAPAPAEAPATSGEAYNGPYQVTPEVP